MVRYAIVRDMTAAGVGLNQFCYAGLITAHLNKQPRPDNLSTKVTCEVSCLFFLLFFLKVDFLTASFFLKRFSSLWSSQKAGQQLIHQGRVQKM